MSDPAEDLADTVARAIALGFGGLMMAGIGLFHLASGLVAPLWAVLLLDLEWLALVLLMWRWRHHPFRVLLVPMASAAFWWAAVTAGDTWLGWTA